MNTATLNRLNRTVREQQLTEAADLSRRQRDFLNTLTIEQRHASRAAATKFGGGFAFTATDVWFTSDRYADYDRYSYVDRAGLVGTLTFDGDTVGAATWYTSWTSGRPHTGEPTLTVRVTRPRRGILGRIGMTCTDTVRDAATLAAALGA